MRSAARRPQTATSPHSSLDVGTSLRARWMEAGRKSCEIAGSDGKMEDVVLL